MERKLDVKCCVEGDDLGCTIELKEFVLAMINRGRKTSSGSVISKSVLHATHEFVLF